MQPYTFKEIPYELYSGLDPFLLVRRCPHLEYLNLSDFQFDISVIEQLVTILKSGKVPKLNEITFARCNLNDETFAPLLEFLTVENQQCIKRLDLSENDLTEITLSKFAEYLSHPLAALQCLSLRDNNLKSTDMRAWGGAEQNQLMHESSTLGKIFSALKSNTSLTLLDLSHNYLNFCDIDYEIFEDFSKNNSLVYLMLGNNRLICNENSAQATTHFFSLLPMKISHLNLSYVGIDSSNIRAIYEASLQKPSLKHLCLSDNILGRDSCHILSLLIRNNTHLRSLNLSDNHLWDSGVRMLSESLGQNTSLRSLKLSRNRIGRAALDIVNSCLTNNSNNLTIDLRTNAIPNDICEQITDLISNTSLNVLLGTM